MMPMKIRERLLVPSVGNVDFGDLRRLEPIDPHFGFSRGSVIDRYYIERFLEDHAADVRGRVLELGDSTYTRRFGKGNVTREDVLHYVEGNPAATIIADLSQGDTIESNLFDCVILTQTLQMIYDFSKAIATLHRILKPGGVILVTTHGTSRVVRYQDEDDWGEYWRFTGQSCTRAFEEHFGPGNVDVFSFGNVLSATAFLHGISADELTKDELDHRDRHYEVLVAVRARKAVLMAKEGTDVGNG